MTGVQTCALPISGTDINLVLEYMTNMVKKRCTAFLISDFIDDHDYTKSMSIANRKHDLVAVQVYDKRDTQLPDVGLLRMRDSETGRMLWVDTSSSKTRKMYDRMWYDRQQKLTETTLRSGVDIASIATDEDFVKSLLGLFRKRGMR